MGFRLKGEDSPGFLALNRNKRSIALDLKNPADRDVLYALVKTADVLVENARPGVAERLQMPLTPGRLWNRVAGGAE